MNKVVRLACFANDGRVDLFVLEHWRENLWRMEVVEVVGRGEPLAFPAGTVPSPNGDRSTIKLVGVDLTHVCLEIEGQAIPFLRAKSSRYPEQDAVDIALRLGFGSRFQVARFYRR